MMESMIMLRRITIINRETAEVAATVTWDGAMVDVEVEIPTMAAAVMAAALDGEILRPESGARFLDAVALEFKRSSYWEARELRVLEAHGITCSMSRRGNCYENAVMESWFSTEKSDEGELCESYAHAKEALFDYIDVFYNQRRRHSTLGQISPAEFERRSTHAA